MSANATCQNATEGGGAGGADLVFVAVYATVFAAGLTLNLVALVVFFGGAGSRSPTTVYMTNLALADLLLALTLPVRVHYHLRLGELPQLLCDGMGLALLANMYSSIFLLTCMCFDRCLAVTFPMSSRVREARKKAPWVCLGVWIITVGGSLPFYIFKKRQASLEGRQGESSCFDGVPVYATQPLAVASTLTVGFGVPLAVMLASSWALVRAIAQSAVAQTDLVDSGKIQRMIATNLAIFLVCFLPYHATLTLLFVYRETMPCPLLAAYRYSLMLACLNAMLDPLAYYFTTETFKEKVDLSTLRRMLPLNSHSSTEGTGSPRTLGPIST